MEQNDFQQSLKAIKKHLVKNTEDRITEPNQKLENKELFCTCKDAHGNQKNLYLTHKEAQQEIKYLLETQRISLNIYPCPHVRGWHLTKG